MLKLINKCVITLHITLNFLNYQLVCYVYSTRSCLFFGFYTEEKVVLLETMFQHQGLTLRVT